ncbi:MAG: 2-oxoglutarate-dependent dioxygenase [Comamonadaceae bacterium]|nr:MAG: 2-oxoglutarate-dependent dioxygenase [Comamonadaceae bacterium]
MSQPANPELRDWIATQLAAGFDHAALHRSMLESGWHDAAARRALAEFGMTPASIAAAEGAGLQAAADVCTDRFANAQPNANAAASPVGRLPGPDLTGAPLLIDAGDRRVRVLQTLTHPRLVVFGDLLSADECEGLIADARRRLARSLTVEVHTGGESINVDRTSEGMFFERGESELVQRIEARIARLLDWPVDHGEGLQVLRYAPGAQYRPHFDYFDPGELGTPTILRRGGQRVATLVIYLGEPERGGATVFPDVGLEVAPQRGNAVFFSYDRPDPSTGSLHGGAPVLAGEKWVATKWLRERVFN